MSLDPNTEIWKRSLALSKPYWRMYERLIGPTSLFADVEQLCTNQSSDKDEYLSDEYYHPEDEGRDEEDALNPEYLSFIEITKKHIAEREKLKKSQQKQELDEYYKDVSEVNTLVEANLVPAPSLGDSQSGHKLHEEKLVKLYGSREAYDKIRLMEMYLDDEFSKKCQKLSPKYWPAMPINLKPYLNPTD